MWWLGREFGEFDEPEFLSTGWPLRPRRPPTSSRSILRLELGLKVVQWTVKPLRTLRLTAIELRVSARELKIPHTVRFYPKYCHFWPTFREEIDESFLRFFSLTLVLLDSILLIEV